MQLANPELVSPSHRRAVKFGPSHSTDMHRYQFMSAGATGSRQSTGTYDAANPTMTSCSPRHINRCCIKFKVIGEPSTEKKRRDSFRARTSYRATTVHLTQILLQLIRVRNWMKVVPAAAKVYNAGRVTMLHATDLFVALARSPESRTLPAYLITAPGDQADNVQRKLIAS